MEMSDCQKDRAQLIRELEEFRLKVESLETLEKTRRGAGMNVLNGIDDKYQALVETTGTGYVVLDMEGRVLDANAEYLRLSGGQTRGEILGKCVTEWTAPRDQEKNAEEVRKCIERGFVRDLEIHYVDNLGNETPVEINATVLQTDDARLILTLCRDITRRKQVEASLLQREEEIRATLESTADGILAVNEEGRIVFFNRQFGAMWRIPQPLLDLGRDEELLAHVLGQLKDPEQFLSKVRELYQSDREGFDTLRFCDGRVFERYSRPLVRGECFSGRVWSFRDVTERHHAEQALKASEGRYRLVTDMMSDYIFRLSVSETGQIAMDMVTDNFYSITGRALGEAHTPDLWTRIVHPDDLEHVYGLLGRLVSAGGSAELECRSFMKDGRMRWVHIVARAIAAPASLRTISIVGAVKDITDRKQAEDDRLRLEAQMLQTQKLESLGVLAGGIAHDFNNILVAILGNADLALQDISRDSPVRPMLKEIDKAAHCAADLCKQMLAYSGRGRFYVKPLDLSGLVQELAQMLDIAISKKVTLRYNLQKGLPSIEADASQIQQVVMNLIINASEAIGEETGNVEVTTGLVECDRLYISRMHSVGELKEGNYVSLEVADTGRGMDASMLEKIFDPFFTTKFTGRGLGLAAVLGIVRSHHGALTVQSELDRGTSFKILFPAVSEPSSIPIADSSERNNWKGSGTVLLVDDEAPVIAVARRMLERLGFSVLTAEDGFQALETVLSHGDVIKCVILDLTMPRMGGEETFIKMRQINPNLRVIMSSGFSEQEIWNRFSGKEISGFVHKPYQLSSLAAVLKPLFPG